MSQIKRTPIFIIVGLIGLMMLAACGSSKPNKKTENAYNSEKGSHSADWLPQKHRSAAEADQNACKECHGEELNGGISGVSCTQCHLGGAASVHPLDWQDNSAAPRGLLKHRWYSLQNGTASCANVSCHGADLKGVAPNGVGCSDCHQFIIPRNDSCWVCHGFPPATAKHSQHVSLQDVDCSVCHFSNHADVSGTSHPGAGPLLKFLTNYTAKTGTTASFDPATNTCSKVSCHGGQKTPSWQSTAVFDVETRCTSCHVLGTAAGSPEYNSYYSGQHSQHVMTCTVCHDTVKLAVNHFTSLSTSTMEGCASATIKDVLQYTAGSCAASCHETRNWFSGN
jgi:predicted CxxxxCH...CXXCH cytochrome family protein